MSFSFLIPVIVVTILNIFLGMIWYSSLMMGTQWAHAHRLEHKKLQAGPWHYLGSMLISFITALMLGTLIDQFQIMAWECGALLALCIWLGFIATTHFSAVIWAQKPLRVYLIDVTYHLISLVMMGALLAAWL